jgi:uncharacterized tellurite resistance protein B-like protein
MTDAKKPTKEEYIVASDKLEKSTNDKVGIVGDIGVAATGATAGILGASAVASFFGASTIFGSTTLAGLAGGVLVTATPIGWVLGTAVAGTAVAVALSRLVRNGEKNDERKKRAIAGIKSEIASYDSAHLKDKAEKGIAKLTEIFALLVENNLIEKSDADDILQGVEGGQIDIDVAFSLASDMLQEINTSNETDILNADYMTVRSVFVILFKHMIHIDDVKSENEMDRYRRIMNENFKSSDEYASKLFDEAPAIEDIAATLQDFKKIIPSDQIKVLIESLIDLGYSDGDYNDKEKTFVENVKKVLES